MTKPIRFDADYQLVTGPNGHRSVQSRSCRGSFTDCEIFLSLPNIPATTKAALRDALNA